MLLFLVNIRISIISSDTGKLGGGCEPERDIILRESLVSNNYFEVKTSYDDYEEAMGKIVDFIGLVFSN